jgi:3-oxoacyl-[acyl-carrier-protein] synthase II
MLHPAPSPADAPRRVVVTGAGLITAHGAGWRANADAFRAGQRSYRPVTLFDVSRQRARTAAEVDLPAALPPTRLSARRVSRLDRAARMLLLAAHEAWTRAGWEPGAELPVVLGTTGGGMALGEDYYRQAIGQPPSRRHQPTRVVHYQAQRQGLDLLEAFDLSGPVTVISNACASGANAIGRAWELVRAGRADRALCGGYDALVHTLFAGFDSLQALSTTRCRPFDARRDGLALGEGAAVLCLEALEPARRRGADILGEIAGYAATTDVHHLTQPHPEGAAARAALRAACAEAGIGPAQVGYLNAHGTGTPLNDAAEALAINHWAGAAAASLPVSSTKAGIGHLLGAAGAVEAVVCLMALREQWLPPQLDTEQPDPLCRFPLVTRPQEARPDHALSNSFGFGGANAVLVFRRWP